MLHVTSQFLYVGDIVPEEQVVGVLVPAEVVEPDDGEVADEAEEAGAGRRQAEHLDYLAGYQYPAR